MNIVLIREWLTDDRIISSREFRKNGLAVFAGQETYSRSALRIGHLGGCQCRRQAFIVDLIGAQPVDRYYAWNAFNFFWELRAKRRVTVSSRRPRRPQVEVRLELAAHPNTNRFAKAADHNSDTDRHGDGRREGCSE